MGNKKCTKPDPADFVSRVIEPKISKYLRYFVWFVLLASIALLAWDVFTGLEDGVTMDDILQENIYYFFFIIMTLIYMSLPGFIQRRMGFVVDQRLIVVISLFIFGGSFLGQALSFFDHFAWWDTMLHMISGIILGLIAFALTSALNASEKSTLSLNPFYVALFSFSFAVAGGALWEIAEYGMDWIFGTTMQCWDENAAAYLTGNPAYQDAAIIDTMEDLIVDTVGALIVSFVGYFYLSKGKPFMEATKIHPSAKEDGKKEECDSEI